MSKPTVFISYSHKDKDWVKDYLLTNLEKNDIPCQIDFRDFEFGKASLICMEEAAETCAKTILVYTPNWVNSEFKQFEGVMLQTESPLNLNKKILPIMLKDCDVPKRLKILNYSNFTDQADWDTQLNRVVTQIKKDLGLEPSPKTYPFLDARHIDISRLPQTGFELFGRQKELTLLNKAWESGTTNVVSFVAYGGVGKSTLINKWVEKLRWENYRGAEKVYAWSFYSQGTNERVTSAEMFIDHALDWFGDADPTQGSAWDKGKRLAKLINTQKTLLILDGMEPLQTAEKVEQGKIKDPALSMLISELAENNKGLCVISTREHVPELDRYSKRTQQKNLEHISNEAGRKLLETRRIAGSEEALELLVEQFGNHALAINLLVEYLRLFENHPLEKAKDIPDLNISEKQGKHPRRIIEAFAKHFGSASAEVQLLSLLGMFDRPVPLDAIKAILGSSPIPGLSENISDIGSAVWLTTLENLRKHKLIFKESEHRTDTLDCHPLIREHFGGNLQAQNLDDWRAAHARLYDYYKNLPEKEFPDTLQEMEPLFAAVTHGCLAGKHQATLDDVYYSRIGRKSEHFTSVHLGALGAEVSCLASFFERLWDKPSSRLTKEGAKAIVLNMTGFSLFAVGRLSDSVQSTKAGLEMQVNMKDWKNAASAASNLSLIYLTLGELDSAEKYSVQGISFADRSGDGFEREARRSSRAHVLHQAGKTHAAEELFREVEAMQKKRTPENPCLYSLQGFFFCDLLLSMRSYQAVLERAQQTIEGAKKK